MTNENTFYPLGYCLTRTIIKKSEASNIIGIFRRAYQ